MIFSLEILLRNHLRFDLNTRSCRLLIKMRRVILCFHSFWSSQRRWSSSTLLLSPFCGNVSDILDAGPPGFGALPERERERERDSVVMENVMRATVFI